jgi:hypothetical protein
VLLGRGLVVASVEVIARGHAGYLHMRASRVSWAVEVACCECIRLCSSDALHCVVSSWSLVYWYCRFSVLVPSALLSLARRVVNCFQDILDVMLYD